MTEEITKSPVTLRKFLISVFLVRANCKTFMFCQYFTLFWFMFVLKLQLLKLEHSQIWLQKQLGENSYQNASIWNVGKGKHMYELLLEMLSRLHWQQPTCKHSLVSLLPPSLALLPPARRVWVGCSLLWSAQYLRVRREYSNWEWFHCHSFKECMFLVVKTF